MASPASPTYVYDFTQGSKDDGELLGGKGANLAEMTRLGLPVPPGFTITTQACREFLAAGSEPAALRVQVTMALRQLEDHLGRRLGDRHDPLLVSVRSGAKFSMPGMMETVLNVGLNDASVKGLADASGDERFAWDSYRRLIQMYGKTVLDLDGALFADALAAAVVRRGATDEAGLDVADLHELVDRYKAIVKDHTGADFPQHPREQLDGAISRCSSGFVEHRPGTAVPPPRADPARLGHGGQRLHDGVRQPRTDLGHGVAFTRDPATGRPGAYGDYLADAQGEDVVAGIRNTSTLEEIFRYLPRLRESFVSRGEDGVERRVNVITGFFEHVAMSEVMATAPHGLDFRDAAWMTKRMLATLGFVHRQGLVHGAVLPPHLLVHPVNHGARLVDWCYAREIGEPLRAVPTAWRSFYPPEVFEKKPATAKTDIFLAAKTALALMGEKAPAPIHRFWSTCLAPSPSRRPDDAWALHDELEALLKSLVGKPKYRPLVMPARA